MSDKSMHFKTSILAIIVIIALILFIGSTINSVFKPKANYTTTVAERIKPIGSVYVEGDIDVKAIAAAPKAAAKTRDGKTVYNTFCTTCHAVGVAGAPKYGNKADWSARVGQGLDGLLKVAISGKGAMPPKGTCGDCTDDELKASINYMLDSIK